MIKHAFVISAYGESRYLEECIVSLINQREKTPVYISTSTPNEHIKSLAKKYNLECFCRNGEPDICVDWNYACNVVDSQWVTVAHQDDIYDIEYASYLSKAIDKNPDDESIMVFSDYRALINDKLLDNMNCKIRRFLRSPMLARALSKRVFWKKGILSLGNSICCPTVTYNKGRIKGDIFTTQLKFNIDWDTFVKLADLNGRFIYINKPLVFYRIHEGATTMRYIDNNLRIKEDTYMFRQFWPNWMVKIIMLFYKKAYAEYTDNKRS